MITIITQNQHVALIIARAIEADKEATRYYYNEKYYVTWMTGKMVEINTPRGLASYWFRNGSFPHLPKHLTLSLTTKNRKDGTCMTAEAAAQNAAIRSLIAKSGKIIVATEPNAEGELNFRYLYSYLGTDVPFSRAIINELTISSIRFAITHPVKAEKYENWYKSARLRDEANWLININARRAVAFAAGRKTYQIGRTSTSVLRMIAERNQEVNNAHAPEKKSFTTLAVKDSEGNIFAMKSDVENSSVPSAESEVRMISVEKTEVKIKTPKLHNLATLQMEAAREYDMAPLKSYEAAMRLYERKLISFPATTATTVTRRRYEECRRTLAKMLAYKNFASVAAVQPQTLQGRAVDTHEMGLQGIVITSVPALVIDDDMSKIYYLIVRRMYQAFSKTAVIIRSRLVAECEGITYSWEEQKYKTKGWHALFPETALPGSPVPTFETGDTAAIFSAGSGTASTPVPRYFTVASLMERLYEERGTSHANEIAKDIIHLEEMGMIKRDIYGHIFLTEKGIVLNSIVKGMKISSMEAVHEIDSLISSKLRGTISKSAFDKQLQQFTADVTAEILASPRLYPMMEEDVPCPHCTEGVMKIYGKVAKCDNPDCGHYVFRQFLGKILDHTQLKKLLTTGTTDHIKGFRSFKGNLFAARVVINSNGNPQVTSKPQSSNT